MSNIKVYVQWEKPSVYAGEDLSCTITFANDATPSELPRSISPIGPYNANGLGRARWFSRRLSHSETQSYQSTTTNKTDDARTLALRHRPTLSLNALSDGVKSLVPTNTATKQSNETAIEIQKHTRSVSIVSIGVVDNKRADYSLGARSISSSVGKNRSLSRHGRAVSFHGVPTMLGFPGKFSIPSTRTYGTPRSGGSSPLSIPSSSFRVSAHSVDLEEMAQRKIMNDLLLQRPPKLPVSGTDVLPLSFKTSQSTRPENRLQNAPMPIRSEGRNEMYGDSLEKPPQAANGSDVNVTTVKVLSPANICGTSRSSVEFCSTSDHSVETLASDYVAPAISRQSTLPRYKHHSSHLPPIASRSRLPETLIMGYVQLMGSFTLDGSLVNLSPFEEIKRKGVIGGQGGGGVVGVEAPKKDNGILGRFTWGDIGESFGGLLGGTGPSSIREMKGIASTKSVPIISTPQSILFVDLKLDPGESRSYAYSYTLPSGVPPTHNGRAMKVAYHLVIGIQRAQMNAPQQIVRHVDIPFIVLPGVDGKGNLFRHDLMNPYIVLQNDARTRSVSNGLKPPASLFKSDNNTKSGKIPEKLCLYIEGLLNKPRQDSNSALMSPTDSIPAIKPRGLLSIKEIIDFTILRGNSLPTSMISPTRFQILRAGERVAVILLARTLYRVGETISSAVDFKDAQVPCHSVHVSLGMSEVVDPAIALRSSSSIQRATRKVYAERSEFAVSAQRINFLSAIPAYSTPEFMTSGVNAEWRLRFEFTTANVPEQEELQKGLIEKIMEDESGTTFAALEGLPCETFEVSIPIRVYGTPIGSSEQYTITSLPI